MHLNRKIFFTAAVIVLAGILAAVDLCYGAPADKNVMLLLRLPRTVTALIAGAALALSGLQMQSAFRNPIADPHIMGVSSGASLGAAAAVLCGGIFSSGAPHALSAAGAAAMGAAASSALIIAVSKKVRSASVLLIFGVMTGFLANALICVMQYSTDADSLKLFYSWSAGSFSFATWKHIAIMAAALAAGYYVAMSNAKGMDLLLFGDDFAQACGADAKGIRLKAMACCCIATGAVTAFCGPVGFVGIIAPHIAKACLGTSSHRSVTAGSMLCGGTVCIAADLVSQLPDFPLPVSATMAFTGIPATLYVLLRDTGTYR